MQGSSQNPYNQYFTKRKEKQLVGKTQSDKFNSAQSLQNHSTAFSNANDDGQEFQGLLSQPNSHTQKKLQNNNYSNRNSQTLTKKKISYGKNETHEIKINYPKRYLKNTSLTVDQQQSERLRDVSQNGLKITAVNQLGVIGISHQQQTKTASNIINLRKLGTKKVFTNNVNISNISTNPSSAQVQVRNQKSVLESHSRQHHLMIMNQRSHENNSVTVLGQQRASNASNSKMDTIKNIYSQIQPINIQENQIGGLNINGQYQNIPKQKKGRNFGVHKSSGVSNFSQHSRDGGNLSNSKPLKYSSYANMGNGMRSNKSKDNAAQNPRNHFGIKFSNGKKQQSIPHDLEIRGQGSLSQNIKTTGHAIQCSQSTEQISGQPCSNDLIKFFGLMQQRQKMQDQEDEQRQIQAEAAERNVNADSTPGLSPMSKQGLTKIESMAVVSRANGDDLSLDSKSKAQSTSAGINYFQSQGKILKQMRSQQKNRSGSQNANSATRVIRGPRQLEPIELKQRLLPDIGTTQTKSEPQTIILQSRTALAHLNQSGSKDAMYVEQTQAIKSQEVTMINNSMGSKIQRKNFARNLQNLGKGKTGEVNNAMSLNDMYVGDPDQQFAKLEPNILNTELNSRNGDKIHPHTGKGKPRIPLTQQVKSIDQWPASKVKNDSSSQALASGEVTYNSIEPLKIDDRSLRSIKNVNNKHDIYQNQKSNQKVHLAPIRGQTGASPNTASATRGQHRPNLNNNRDIESRNSNSGNMMQYKLPSQQCQSEIFPLNNFNQQRLQDREQDLNNSGYDGQQAVFNLNSNFEDSFEVFREKSQQDIKDGGNGLDPNMGFDMNHIPSVNKITAIRNQKSQGTYRHNHKKISGVRGIYNRNIPTQHELNRKNTDKFLENNFGGYEIMAGMSSDNMDMVPSQTNNMIQFMAQENTGNYCSQSEAHDKYSLSNINDINSQINEGNMQPPQVNNNNQLNQISQVSHISQNSEQKSVLAKNQSYLSKRDTISLDDQPHPFNGPKLHLFRKGQSKSSQSKLRKIKTSEKNQRLIDLNSQAGYSHNQTKSNQNNNKIYLSEGGGVQSVNILPKLNANKEGFLNIQDILDANNFQGVGQQMNALRVYADINSQGNISQNSNDIGKNRTLQNSGDKQGPPDIGDHQECRSQVIIKQQQYTDQQSMNDHDYSRITNSDLTGYDHGMIPFQSQGGTIQHTTIYSKGGYRENSQERPKGQRILPGLTSSSSSQNVLQKNKGPIVQINGQSDASQQFRQNDQKMDNSKSEKQLQKLDFKYKNSNLMRPNTTNPSNLIQEGVSNNRDTKSIEDNKQKFAANSSSNCGSFHHPRVGKSSKHPEIFKHSKGSSSKNISRQIVQSKLLNESQGYKQMMENGADDFNSMKSSSPLVQNSNKLNYNSHKDNSPLELMNNQSEQSIMQESGLSSSRRTGQFETIKTNRDQIQNQQQELNEFKQLEAEQNKIISESHSAQKANKCSNQPQAKQQESKIEQITLNDFKIGIQDQNNNNLKQQQQIIKSNQINKNKDKVKNSLEASQNRSFSESVQKQNSIKIIKQPKMPANVMNQDTLGNHQVKKQIMRAQQNRSDDEVFIQSQNSQKIQNYKNDKPNMNNKSKTTRNDQKVAQCSSQQDSQSDIKQYTDQEYTNMKYQIPVNIKENTQFALTQQKLSKAYTATEVNRLYSETVTSNENTAPIQSGQPQPAVSSVAQTPCFAETPNTTDQFKGYKIDPTDNTRLYMDASNSNFNVQLNISESLMEGQLNHQQSEESP